MNEVVIISGKGGTGKTTLTAALAALWTNTVIADCDVDAADLHLLLDPQIDKQSDFTSGVEAVIDSEKCTQCGVCRDVCHFDAISSDFIINPIACEGCAVCHAFCPVEAITLNPRQCGEWFISKTRFGPMVHARLGVAEENSGKLVSLIRREAKQIAETSGFSNLLVDGSPGIGCPVIASITGASLVVVVTEPTVAGAHDMERVLGLACHFKIPAVVIVNKADLNSDMDKAITEHAESVGSPVIGRIPYDPSVTKAMVQGQTVIEYGHGNAVAAIEEISTVLLSHLETSLKDS